MMTVKDVSNLTGISVRTLHYYDEIGLLKPTKCNKAGYRLYDDKALETLQQILFFKEFDMSLKDIKTIMDNPSFDKEQTLKNQKKILMLKVGRLNGLIRLIDDILKGENKMSFHAFRKEELEDMFQSMIDNMEKNQIEDIEKNYGDLESFKDKFIANAVSEEAQDNFLKIIEWYGCKETVLNVVKNTCTAEIMQLYQVRISEIYKQLSLLKEVGTTLFEVKKLVAEYEYISKQLYQLKEVKPLLMEIAKEYMENGDLIKANDEQYGKGSSIFIGKAIIDFYQNQ